MKILARLSNLVSRLGQTTFTITTDCNPADLERFIDKDLTVELKVKRKKRSLEANAKFWACLQELADAFGEKTDELYQKELEAYGKSDMIYILPDAVEDFKQSWVYDHHGHVRDIGTTDIVGADGSVTTMEILICYYGSHTYNSKEFARLLQGVIDDMDNAGIPSYEMRMILKDLNDTDN